MVQRCMFNYNAVSTQVAQGLCHHNAQSLITFLH